MDVLVTDGNQRATLAVVRSLGQRGIAVTVAESGSRSLAACSKYCSAEFVCPAGADDPAGFQRELVRYLKARPHKVLIPMTDIACYLIDEIRDELEPHVKIALPGREAFGKASDKKSLMLLARALHVPIPKTIFIENLDELEGKIEGLNYPVVIKPARSRKHTGSGWINGQVEYAYSQKELVEKYKVSHAGIEFPLIQERIEGPGHGVFLLFGEGERLASCGHRRLREKPPSGGVSVLREAIQPDEQTLAQSCSLLKALNWSGPAMVEFKIDRKDGTPRLMEINGRLWGSLQLAIDAGVDFPYFLYQMMLGQKPGPIGQFRPGIKSRWLLGDLDHLLIILLNKRSSLALPANYPGRLATLADFLESFFARDTRGEIWRRDDPAPAFCELKAYLRTSWRSLKERLF